MNILSSLGLGFAYGLITSIPILVLNYYLCKRFDKLIEMTEEINSRFKI
jgi:hypothetical protein